MPGAPLLVAFLVALLVAAGGGPAAGAAARVGQDATPDTVGGVDRDVAAAEFPVTPDPAECTVAPRAVESLLALLGTPAAARVPANGTPAAGPSRVEVPVGRPADEAVAMGVIATVRELYACFNAGDLRRAFALVTDDFLRAFGAAEPLTEEDVAFFAAEPVPVPAEARSTLLAVTDVAVLADGRAGAFVVAADPFTGPDTVYMVFVRQGERWLVDDIIGFLEP